jgi:hypothetical protein
MKAIITGSKDNRTLAVIGATYDSREHASRWLLNYQQLHPDIAYSIEFIE